MSQIIQFHAVIKDAGGGGAYVVIPFDVEKVFGRKRVKIKATIDSEPYRGTLVRMGSPYHILVVLKEIRQRVGKSVGDEVAIEIEEDLEVRKIDIPSDLQAALEANPTALDFYSKLSYTHQKEYVRWVIEAKRESTRQERIHKMIAMLEQGKGEH